MSTRVLELELDGEAPEPVDLDGCRDLRILARYRGRPVGWLSLPADGVRVRAADLQRAVLDKLGWKLVSRVLESRLAPRSISDPHTPPVSVVVCTRDRASLLEGCLAALAQVDYPDHEVIVVDNGSADNRARRLAEAHGFRYVHEDVPGLDRARNRGIRAARHPIVAFTDDDARPDARWLHGLARAFQDRTVDLATGLVAPEELRTEAQTLFEDVYGGMGKGLESRVIRPKELDRRRLLWASSFGCGANMAFRKGVFETVGGFDPALDAGTPTGGAGDVEMIHRSLAAGLSLAYEPAAVVWHRHRRSRNGLRRQLFDNGRSFGSYLLTCGRRRTVPRRAIVAFWLGSWMGGWILPRLLRPRGLPRSLVAAELAGAFWAPFAYAASRRRESRLSQASPRTGSRGATVADGGAG